MKTKVLILQLIICSFWGCSDSKPKWTYQDDLELAEIYINRVIELNEDEKFLGTFKKAGRRIELIDIGDLRLVAFVDLSDVKIISKNDNTKDIIIYCPDPQIKSQYEHVGYDSSAIKWECIDILEGRNYYTEIERQDKINEAVIKLNEELKDQKKNKELRYELFKAAKESAESNLPVFFRRCNPEYEDYSINIVFESEKNNSQELQSTKQ